ncbi:hypothetical protein [uncultured Treponema sp.]|nr:hypothetical protein [uncultured Treponema sp.]
MKVLTVKPSPDWNGAERSRRFTAGMEPQGVTMESRLDGGDAACKKIFFL